jgi:hypothetical protein
MHVVGLGMTVSFLGRSQSDKSLLTASRSVASLSTPWTPETHSQPSVRHGTLRNPVGQRFLKQFWVLAVPAPEVIYAAASVDGPHGSFAVLPVAASVRDRVFGPGLGFEGRCDDLAK